MNKKKYDNVESGVWERWDMKNHEMCCDCGLVHKMDFKVKRSGNRNYIYCKIQRDERATAAARRKKQVKK